MSLKKDMKLTSTEWCHFGEWTLTRSIRNSETSIDFVQGLPDSRRERVKKVQIQLTSKII